jgi:hypothetical protein
MLAEALIMVVRVAGIALALVCAGAARNNESNAPPETSGENESVVINAKLYAKPDAVKEILGSDLGGHYIVVAIEVTPRFGKEVAINRDDFVLKTDKERRALAGDLVCQARFIPSLRLCTRRAGENHPTAALRPIRVEWLLAASQSTGPADAKGSGGKLNWLPWVASFPQTREWSCVRGYQHIERAGWHGRFARNPDAAVPSASGLSQRRHML